jgi:spore maturation protein SpmA
VVLNYIWIGFILIAVVVALIITFVTGNGDVLNAVMNSMFDSAKTGFEISIGLTGILTLWLGIMKIGEKGGAISFLARITSPFFCKIFPEIPKNHPALGSMFMNFSANMLGIDNAATPLGLKAMQQLQELNPKKDTASNAMIMFLVLNTAGLTLIPVTVMTYQAQFGAKNPADILLPTIIASTFSTIVALVCVAIRQKINPFQRAIILTLGTIISLLGLMIWGVSNMSPEQVGAYSKMAANFILLGIICAFIITGIVKKINVYDAFIEGAKEGFSTAVKIIPFLIAILVAIGMFRASGAMDFLLVGISKGLTFCHIPTDFVPALPTAIMKSLSGTGARGMMVDALKTYGTENFVSKVCCILQGSSDTTFYILALYFGSVGIKKTRYALSFGLLADLVAVVAAIFLGYLFFGWLIQ